MRYLKGRKIGIIGLGNMGHAIIRGLVSSGSAKGSGVIGFDCDPAKCRAVKRDLKIRIADSVAGLASRSDAIVIAVKPQDIAPVLGELASSAKGSLIISIAAGVRTERIERALGRAHARRPRVIRVMPNTPALVGEGISVICKGRYARPSDLKVAFEIFASVGDTLELGERYFDLVTAISGSGPAYFFYLKEALIGAAVRLGMKKTTAKKLVLKTAFGAAKLLIETGHEPQVLRQRVTSKGGTTEQAIKVLDKAGFKSIVEKAIIAAARHSRELSKG